MGIIRAAVDAVKGGLADTWLEVIQPEPMGGTVVMVPGQKVTHGKSQNTKGTPNTVSNGSMIQVHEKQCMLLIDGGKVVDFTAEPGYYQVSNSSMPSLFCGQLGDSLKETFSRIKYGGIPSQTQYVIYINLAEIPGILFGTKNPVNYFDSFYNSELFIRAHGTYSIKITDPLKFYQEVIDKGLVTTCQPFDYKTKQAQYSLEFEAALGSAINQYSADGFRVSFIKSKSREFGKYMAETLDEDWETNRGFQVQTVAIDISYSEDSQELINMRNKGAMMSDAAVQQGYAAANISEGMKAAGSNANGAMAGFMGMGVGMNAAGGIMGGYQQNPHYNNQQPQQMYQQQPMQQQQQPMQQPQPQQPQQQQPQQAAPAQAADGWTCACGTVNTGKFCSECGAKKPEAPKKRFCTNCGSELAPNQKFCSECGTKAE